MAFAREANAPANSTTKRIASTTPMSIDVYKRQDVKAAKFSETAQKAIEAAGGTAEVV